MPRLWVLTPAIDVAAAQAKRRGLAKKANRGLKAPHRHSIALLVPQTDPKFLRRTAPMGESLWLAAAWRR